MNKLLLTVAAALLMGAPGLLAQEYIPAQNAKGKWGYVDEQGNVVIKYDYAEVSAFVDGRAKVKKGDKWGYIDTSGKEVIKIQYSEMGTWENGRCKVAVGGSMKDNVLKDAKYGFIDATGAVLLKPEYNEIGAFKDGLAYVKKGDKYGYIDNNLSTVVECKYTAIGKFNDLGYCWVSTGGKMQGGELKNGVYGICTRDGRIAVKPNYAMIGTFVYDVPEANPVYAQIANSPEAKERMKALAKDATKGLTSKSFAMAFTGGSAEELNDEVMARQKQATDAFENELRQNLTEDQLMLMSECPSYNMLGYKFIEPKLFSELDMSRSTLIAVSRKQFRSKNTGSWSIQAKGMDMIGIVDVDTDRPLVQWSKYNVAFIPSEGLAAVVKTDKKGYKVNYVNADNKLLLKEWVYAVGVSPFIDGKAVIQGTKGQYIIDRNGNVLSQSYDLIMPASDGKHIVKTGSGFGIITTDGSQVVAPNYEVILPLSDGYYCARRTDKDPYGYLGADGRFAIEPMYAHASSFRHGAARVKSDTGWGIINTTNAPIVKLTWDDIKPFTEESPELCWAKTGSKWSCIKVADGTLAFEPSFYDADNFEAGRAVVYDEVGLAGCIDTNGKLVVPMRMSSKDIVNNCLRDMTARGATEISDIEAYRFNINSNPARNKYRLSNVISNEMWDY